MSAIWRSFVEGYTAGPFHRLDLIFALDPRWLVHIYVLFAALFLVNDLLRTALMSELVRSVWTHLIVLVLTLFPGALLGIVLLWAGHRHPDRVWINLGVAAALYPWWIAGGAVTRLARRDTEGADLGWIFHGALITFPLGLLAAVIFR